MVDHAMEDKDKADCDCDQSDLVGNIDLRSSTGAEAERRVRASSKGVGGVGRSVGRPIGSPKSYDRG